MESTVLYKTLLVWRWRCVCLTSNEFCDGVLGLDSLLIPKSPVHPLLLAVVPWGMVSQSVQEHLQSCCHWKEGTVAPSAITTPECHSWTSPFGSHSSSITKPQTQCEQRNCKDYGRCPGVYLGFPCTSCCSARTLAWPIMNNYTRYFLLESSARSTLQRWILERLLCHQSSDKGKSLSVYRHLLDICCDFLNILFLWRIHNKTYL